jgi:hypothetical protein
VIGHDTPARDTVSNDDESTFFAFSINPAALRSGRNVLAVEIHQRSGTSSDISFDLSLEGSISTATPVVLTNSGTVASRAKTGNSWSALNQATFIVDVPTVTISEIHYNPAAPPLGSVYVAGDFEFIEIHNFGTAPVDLNGVRLIEGISFDFTGSDVSSLSPGGYAVVVADREAFLSRHAGFDTSKIAGEFTSGSLNNGGEDIVLVDLFDEVIVELDYDDGWHSLSDGAGFSLTRIDAADRLADLSKKVAWRPSSHILGSPGEADSADVPVPDAIVINEILSHTDTVGGDQIELLNTSAQPIVIGGWFLSDDVTAPKKYRIADGTTIAPGEFLVFSEESHFASTTDPGVLVSFALSELGEQAVLTAAQFDGTLLGFQARQSFGAAENGISFGRLTKSTGGTDLVATQFPTLGVFNAPPKIGPVVIHELLYHPIESGAEFIELKNVSSEPVSLAGWSIEGIGAASGGDFLFDDKALVPPRGLLLVVPVDPQQFRQTHNVSADVSIVGPYSGALNNAGENVRLNKPGAVEPGGIVPMVLVDRVKYNDNAPWPEAADGFGASLQRRDPLAYGNDAGNWAASFDGGTPGVVPPQVVQVLVGSSQWSTEFVEHLAAGGLGSDGFAIPTGPRQLEAISWINVDQIRIGFSQDVSISRNDLRLIGAAGGELSAAEFNYDRDQRQATWTFAAPLRADKLLLELSDDVRDAQGGQRLDGNWANTIDAFPSGNGIVESDDAFRFRFDVLPGDGFTDGRVDRADLVRIISRLSASTEQGGYDARLDVDGSGRIDLADLRSVLLRVNTSLPTVEPIASPSGAAIKAIDEFFGRAGQSPPAPVEAATIEAVTIESSTSRRRSSPRRKDSRTATDTAMQAALRHDSRPRSSLRRSTTGRRLPAHQDPEEKDVWSTE